MFKKRPNILFIMSDQHRFDCIGSNGNNVIKTPNLDQLSEEAVVYDNSFCAAPMCTPSRYSVMTGLYPHQHQGYSNVSNIPEGTDTFPRILQNHGYKTKAVGKMHFTPTYLDIGFDEMVLAEQNGEGRFEDDYHQYLKEQGLVDQIDLWDQVEEYRRNAPQHYWDSYGALESNLPEEYHSTHWIGNQALSSLEQWNDSEQQCMMVSFISPHHPFDPPAPWSQMYDPNDITLLPGWTDQCILHDLDNHKGFFPHEGLTEERLRKIMSYYYASISHIDDVFGQMIALLKRKGLYDNTLIVYTSDHGEYMGFHHMLLKNNHMYDPLVKVPLMIKYPGQNKGTRTDALVSNVDLAPTILKQAQCPKGTFMSGHDLSDPSHQREFVFAEKDRGQQYMIRSKDLKLLLNRDANKSLFYDLLMDPLEMINMYKDEGAGSKIIKCKELLHQFLLFEAPSPVHLNMNAKSTRKGQNREQMTRWIREQMK